MLAMQRWGSEFESPAHRLESLPWSGMPVISSGGRWKQEDPRDSPASQSSQIGEVQDEWEALSHHPWPLYVSNCTHVYSTEKKKKACSEQQQHTQKNFFCDTESCLCKMPKPVLRKLLL